MTHRHRNRRSSAPASDGSFARVATLMRWAVVMVGALAVAGVVALWPRGEAPRLYPDAADLQYPRATVSSVEEGPCPGEGVVQVRCRIVTAELRSGPGEGSEVTFGVQETDLGVPHLAAGDRVVLERNASLPQEFRYGFADFERDLPLLALGVLFALAVVGLGRLTGLRALLGLAASLAIVLVFMLPALLRAEPPLAVALAGATLIAYVAVFVTHGVSAHTTVALFGMLGGVLVVGAIASAVVSLATLTGISDDSAQILQVTAEAIDLRGLLIAGIVIGAMGVLDDVTMIQVAAVDELRAANPRIGLRELYSSAVRIGRDHIASTVNTLVLAYVGAGLPLLLLFLQSPRPLGGVLASEIVAIEIVRTLAGSIGLIVAIPITTALAAVVLRHGASGRHAAPW